MGPVGHNVDRLQELMKRLGTTNVDDVVKFLGGKDFANKAQLGLLEKMGGVGTGLDKSLGGKGARFAGSKGVRNALRAVPGISVGLTALDAADVVAGPDSLGNKAMDATAMTLGGTAGFFLGGPLGAATGASVGKMVSDGAQSIFGGGKSAEERKLEEALKLLQQRGLA